MLTGRERRRFPWETILGKQFWCATELQPYMQISTLNVRRYLRRSYYANRLMRKKFGRIYYYGVRLFAKPPIEITACDLSECPNNMEHFANSCGCEFFLCVSENHINPDHSIFHWCERHSELLPERLKGKELQKFKHAQKSQQMNQTPIIRVVSTLQGALKSEAKRRNLSPDDLVIVTAANHLEKVVGDPVSYLLKRSQKLQSSESSA